MKFASLIRASLHAVKKRTALVPFLETRLIVPLTREFAVCIHRSFVRYLFIALRTVKLERERERKKEEWKIKNRKIKKEESMKFRLKWRTKVNE